MRIVLTGGTGFLGLALAEALPRSGAEVVCAGHAPPPGWAREHPALAGAAFRTVDVRDRAAMAALLRDVRPDLLIHAAAATPDAAREAAGDAAEIVAINVAGAANAVEAAVAAGVGRVMALSSVAVYGRTLAEVDRLSEDLPPTPSTLYGITKEAGERLALRLGRVHGVEVLAPRVGVLWGPWEHRTALRATPSPPFGIAERLRAGEPAILPCAASAPLMPAPDAAALLARLAGADWRGGGPVNLGAARSTDLAGFAGRMAARLGGSAWVDPAAANVALLSADRPPMDPGRLRGLIGPLPEPEGADAQIDRYALWLQDLADPAAPFAAH